jgi:hypothetical protein
MFCILVWCCILCLIRCASSGHSLCDAGLVSFLLIRSIFLYCASCSRFAHSIWSSCGSLFDLIFPLLVWRQSFSLLGPRSNRQFWCLFTVLHSLVNRAEVLIFLLNPVLQLPSMPDLGQWAAPLAHVRFCSCLDFGHPVSRFRSALPA